jgi:hypothetical protein
MDVVDDRHRTWKSSGTTRKYVSHAPARRAKAIAAYAARGRPARIR